MPLLTDGALALDPASFAEAAGVVPDDWQRRLLLSTAPKLLLNCSRQVGKSTVVALLALHEAIYAPESLTLILSPSLRQSGLLFRRVLDFYRRLGRPVAAETENKSSLELEGGSLVVSLPGTETTIRGFSGVSLLIVDEAARCEDALYNSLLPTLAVSQGRQALLSTPHGTAGFFFEAYRRRDEFDYFEVPASACSRIPPAFLAEQRRILGPWWYQQEYCCAFESAEDSVFRREDIEAALAAGGPAWDW